MAFSFATIYEYQKNSGSMLFDWRMIPAALAMLMIIPCEIGAKPFDIAEAETEICEGPLVEYGGRLLALYKLSHAVKALIVTWLFASLFLSGIGTGIIAVDTVILLALCIVITVVCVSLLKAVTARLKIEKVFKFYWSIPSALALASLIIVWIGI